MKKLINSKSYIKSNTMSDVDDMEQLIIDALGTDGYYEAVSRALDYDTKADIYDYIIRVYDLDYEEKEEEE